MKLLRRVRSWSWKKRIAVASLTGFLGLVVLLVLGYVLTTVPQPSKIATDQATVVLYADGHTVMGTIGKNRTILTTLSDVSKPAQQAVLAAEDRDFYSEPGISPKGIARALFTNVKAGGTTQGGSTITQQYAKNAFLTSQRTYTRKIKEVFIAVKMSQTVSKDTILLDYLNTIYFGRGAYGIEAASKTYFGVHASQLTVTQSAVLASSIRSPAGYDPAKHLAAAKARWAYVLKGMVDKGWLSAAQKAAEKYPTVQPVNNKGQFAGPLDGIRQQVLAELAQHGYDEDRIAAGGLIVQTTISKAAEDAAKAAVEGQISAPSGTNPPVGALVSIQPSTGRVVAYYGARTAGGFDYAGGGKGVQPGSSMKPYVLATALTQGKTLSTTYNGASHQDICGQKDVTNDSGDPAFGYINLSTALEYSVNTVYLHLACDVGPQKVADLAHAAGIASSQKLDGDTGTPSAQIALGSGGYEVRPIDQADGYATFAAQGQHAAPFFVESVRRANGGKQYGVSVKKTQAFTADVAADATSAMEKVVSGGTGTRAQLAGGRPTAGKTGTTSANTNAWFCGFTASSPTQIGLATAVWVGRANGGPLKDVHFESGTITGGVYGGKIPAQIFKAYMDVALDGTPNVNFAGRTQDDTPSTPVITSTPSATPSGTPSATPSATPSPTHTPIAPTSPPSLPPVLPTQTPSTEPSSSPSATSSP